MTTSGGTTIGSTPLSDLELVDAIAIGRPDALSETYRRHGAHVHRSAVRLCGGGADDIVQDVFLRLWHRPERFDPARGSLRAFLVVQARSLALDLLRRDGARRARESLERPEPTARTVEVEATALALMARDTVRRGLAALPDRERQPIVLAYFGEYSYTDVAVILRQPVGTVKSRIRSGLKRLRAQMGDDELTATDGAEPDDDLAAAAPE